MPLLTEESQQRRRLRLFEAIASTTPDFLYAFDLEGRFIYANRRLLEVWGKREDEAIGKNLYELGYPAWHADMHMRELRQVIATKMPIKGEVPFTGGSGISGIYEYIFSPVAGADGRVEIVIGTARDVTARKRAETQLLQSRRQWDLAVQALELGLWSIELPQGRVEESDHLISMLGLPRGTRHRSAGEWAQFVHPDDLEQARRQFAGALEGSCEFGDEYRVIGADGVLRWIQVKGTLVRDQAGKALRMLGVAADVTRRKEDERATAHLAAIVESSDDAIVSKTLDGIIRSWNSGAQRIFGYTAQEAIGHSVLMLLPPDRRGEETNILARLTAGERIEHYESIALGKDGRNIEVSLTISPVRDSRGRIIGASKVARDITRQKQSERELEAARALAQAANRAKDELLESERAARAEMELASRTKDEFLATLSHELRTPLNAILGWAQILRSSPTTEDVRDGAEIIERNARAQTQIIEDLLDMSRIISGKVRLEVQRLDLANAVEAAVETVRPAAAAKGLRLETALDPMLAPVSGDANRLQQVFWNLLSNAVKFTPRGGRVRVAMERVNGHLEVSVSDTGEGIDSQFIPFVFDRFRQADSTSTRRHGGLGLGLAIVKQLVELHGGGVRAASGGLGAGSTFTVSLPEMAAPADPEPDLERRRRGDEEAPPLLDETRADIEGVKVLVVDDEPDARALVKRLLEEYKARVITAESAAAAMRMIVRQRPDVIVSDIGMPNEDGYSLIKRIRALPPEAGGRTPAVALTAYARPKDRMKALVSGFEQYLVKPVEAGELITLVAVLSGKHRQ